MKKNALLLWLALLLTPLGLSAAGSRIWTIGENEPVEESWLSRKTGGFLSDGKPQGTNASRIELGPLGELQLRDGSSLDIVDPHTGKLRWSRNGGQVLPVLGTPYALAWDGKQLTCIDYETGATRWSTSKDSPIGGLEGFYSFVPIGDLGIVLLFGGKWRQQFTDVVAAELASGRPVWKSSEILLREVKAGQSGSALDSLHPPVVSPDGVVLFLDDTGPVKIDPTNGKVVWRSIPFQKAVFGSGVQPGLFYSANWFGARTPPMFSDGDRLYVVAGETLYGFDMKTGKQLWVTSKIGGFMPKKRYDTPVRAVVPSSHGLVVYGNDIEGEKETNLWVDVVDPATGAYRFKKPIKVFKKGISEQLLRQSGRRYSFVVAGDFAFVAGGDKIERVDLKQGKTKEVDSPGGSRAIVYISGHDGDLFVRGANWMGLVDAPSGKTVYQRTFKAPERSYWDQALDGAIAIGMAYARQEAVKAFADATSNRENALRNAAAAEQYRRKNLKDLDDRLAKIGREGAVSSANARDFAYFFAGDGKRGSNVRNIEKVRKSDGKTAHVTQLDTTALDVRFVVDPVNNRFYINDGATIFAQSIE